MLEISALLFILKFIQNMAITFAGHNFFSVIAVLMITRNDILWILYFDNWEQVAWDVNS